MSVRLRKETTSSPPSARLREVLAAGFERRSLPKTQETGMHMMSAEKDAAEWRLEIKVNEASTELAPSKAGVDGKNLETPEDSEHYRIEMKISGMHFPANRTSYGAALAKGLVAVLERVGLSSWQDVWQNDSYTCGNPEASYYHIVAMTTGGASESLKAAMRDAGFGFEGGEDVLMSEWFVGNEALPFAFERKDVMRGNTIIAKYAMMHSAKRDKEEKLMEKVQDAADAARQRRGE
ncbi:MAG: hypothetical protein CMJ72_15285 [Planctomycetaceae bacterium]|nr:hypothetical protein [Planctomycetaceae bacterium]